MRKRVFCVVLGFLLLFCALPVEADGNRTATRYLEINSINFPDSNFREYLLETQAHSGDAQSGYYMTKAQVLAVKTINLSNYSITDFKGLERFTELRSLQCGSYEGTGTAKNLGFAKLTKLTQLVVINLKLVNPDLSKNTALTILSLESTGTETLDLSKNVNLTDVSLFDTRIRHIDLSPLKKLQSFRADMSDLEELDVSENPELRNLSLCESKIRSLDVRSNAKLESVIFPDSSVTQLILGSHPAMNNIDAEYSRIKELDLSGCPNVTELHLMKNQLNELDLSACTKLRYLNCSGNRIGSLDLSATSSLIGLYCNGNCLTELVIGSQPNLTARYVKVAGQRAVGGGFAADGDRYGFDLHTLVSDLDRVTVNDTGVTYDPATGIVSADEPKSFTYLYDTGFGSMDVAVCLPFDGTGTIEWDPNEMLFRDKTPYVLYTGAKRMPGFSIIDGEGKTVDPVLYTYCFSDNTAPGTAMLTVSFKGTDVACSARFKIYLPATTQTSVANIQDGIRIGWAPVKGAKGYVIYRRAWNLISDGWTTFERWNNTTETEWTDTKVYAGTRYQYGVKAYYSDPMDTYNLGVVGPLKTTVRITTRTLKSVTAGTKQMTVKWTPSKNFTGYQIKYATDASFTKNVGAVKVESATASSKTVTGLKTGTTYYVTVRSYHVFNGMTYFGEWSNALSCTVK